MLTIPEALAKALELHRAGDLLSAEHFYRQIVALDPSQADAWHLLGMAIFQAGQAAAAIEYLDRAIALLPDAAVFHYNFGLVLNAAGLRDRAVQSFRRSIALQPNSGRALNDLAGVLQLQGHLEEAEESCRAAIRIVPGDGVLHNNLAAILLEQGRCSEALASSARAVELSPELSAAHANYLVCLQCLPEATAEQLATGYAAWNGCNTAGLVVVREPFKNSPAPDRPLRVGFVSADLCEDAIGLSLLRLLESLDQREMHTCFYATSKDDGALTRRIQRACSLWRDATVYNSDKLFARDVRSDRIDILFSLPGLLAGYRPLLFANRAAPVQVSWLGYLDSSRLTATDYLLTDRFHDPDSAQRSDGAQVARMDDGWICYAPRADAPEVSPLPAARTGFVTFGSFNHPARITPQAVELWSKILRRVDDSRLRFEYRGFERASVQARYWQMFAAHGIAPERIEMHGGGTPAELLTEYQHVDLALDPIPCSVWESACDALWMGVPVVTCPGDMFVSRHAYSLLSAVGLTETIARDHEDYVDLAVNLASDRTRLIALRSGLRGRVAASPLCEGPRFARGFETVCRDLWRHWLSHRAAGSAF